MEYHRTKDILHAKDCWDTRNLKHQNIYTYLINFESNEWHVAHAKNPGEKTQLIEAGFEYVRHSGKDDVAIYRKHK